MGGGTGAGPVEIIRPTHIGRGIGISLIETMQPTYSFLEGDFGREIHEEVQNEYGRFSVINEVVYDEASEMVKGQTPFYIVAVDEKLRERGLRVATQADLERVISTGALELRGTYEDTGLVLRSKKDMACFKNTSLAKDLGKQVKDRGFKFSPKSPLMIPLTEFELENIDNDYGLRFILRKDAEIYEAPVLSKRGKFSSEDIDEKTGLPTKLGEGNRALYTGDSGLSRLCLHSKLGLGSHWNDLAFSYLEGRVVVVDPKTQIPLEQKVLIPQEASFTDEERRQVWTVASDLTRGVNDPLRSNRN